VWKHIHNTGSHQTIAKIIDQHTCVPCQRRRMTGDIDNTGSAEIGQILAGDKPGRTTTDERILGLPLGLAITDVALGKLVLDKLS